MAPLAKLCQKAPKMAILADLEVPKGAKAFGQAENGHQDRACAERQSPTPLPHTVSTPHATLTPPKLRTAPNLKTQPTHIHSTFQSFQPPKQSVSCYGSVVAALPQRVTSPSLRLDHPPFSGAEVPHIKEDDDHLGKTGAHLSPKRAQNHPVRFLIPEFPSFRNFELGDN